MFVRHISGCGRVFFLCLFFLVSYSGFVSFCGSKSRTVCLCQGPRVKAFILCISITKAVTEILLPAPLPVHSLSLSLSDGLTGFFAEERSLQLKSYISVWKRSGLKQGWGNSDRQKTQESSTRTVFRPKSLTDFFTGALNDVSAGYALCVLHLEFSNADRRIGIDSKYHTSQNSAN